eukprot:640680-Amphidinium_carterae.1
MPTRLSAQYMGICSFMCTTYRRLVYRSRPTRSSSHYGDLFVHVYYSWLVHRARPTRSSSHYGDLFVHVHHRKLVYRSRPINTLFITLWGSVRSCVLQEAGVSLSPNTRFITLWGSVRSCVLKEAGVSLSPFTNNFCILRDWFAFTRCLTCDCGFSL